MSKKNLKNSAQNSNYKIEALEPRFMMDANVDLDGFGNQIDNFSSVVEILMEFYENLVKTKKNIY